MSSPTVAFAQRGRCVEKLTVHADSPLVDEVRAALAAGALGEWNAADCRPATLSVRREAGRLSFALTRASDTVDHSVDHLEALVTWVESWMAPGAAEPELPLRATEPPVVHEAAPAPRPYGAPLHVTFRPFAEFDAMTPLWVGSEASIRVLVHSHLWFGVTAAWSWGPEQHRTERQALRLGARLGWLHSWRWAEVAVGSGVGLVSARASRADSNGPSRDDASGPFIDASLSLAVRVSSRLSIALSVDGRAYVPEDFGPGGRDSATSVEPVPLAPASVSMGLGLGWDVIRGAR